MPPTDFSESEDIYCWMLQDGTRKDQNGNYINNSYKHKDKIMDLNTWYLILGILFYIGGIVKNLLDTWNTNE